MERIRAFTLVELVVAISIAAVMLAFAVPPLLATLKNSAATALGNDLVSSLNLARTEAVKRGANVTLCTASDKTLSACGSGQTWTFGWLVFVDANGDGVYSAGNDTLIKTNTIPNGATLTATFNNVTFTSAGFVKSVGALIFTAQASGCTGNNARTITVQNPGHITLAPVACS